MHELSPRLSSGLRVAFAVLALTLVSLGLASCGGDSESSDKPAAAKPKATAAGHDVKVELGEEGSKYFIKVDTDKVSAGATTFQIDNVGTMHHELAIVRTDLPAGKLPLNDEGKVDEDKVDIVGEAVYATPLRGDPDHRIREERGIDYTIDLPPGDYVLLCNLAGHYQAGQYVAFTVEGDAGNSAGSADSSDGDATKEEPATDVPAPESEVKGTAVKADLGEAAGKYFVKLDKNQVPAGTTTFVIDNVGTMHHELVIFKTDLPAAKLPLNDEGKVDEDKVAVIGEAEYVTPTRGDPDHRIRDGRGVNYTVDLEPGKYVLVCNLAGHYQAGQHVAFTVR